MSHLKRDWKLLSAPFNTEIMDALQQQHQASQFIALIGKYLVPTKADDSHTNMEFVFKDNALLGNALPSGFRIALGLTDLRINILDQEFNSKKEISLDGKTKQTVFEELKQSLFDLGVNVADFTNELHYEIPEHALDKGAIFSLKNKSAFIENANYRYNAELVINEIAKPFEKAEAVKIWPHHFDTGSFIPVSKNEKGELSQSIGLGWAMPDTMVEEPYYYLSFWSENPIDGSNALPALKAGHWMMPNWNGAVLKQSEIMKLRTAEGQFEIVKSYFMQGIEILLEHFE